MYCLLQEFFSHGRSHAYSNLISTNIMRHMNLPARAWCNQLTNLRNFCSASRIFSAGGEYSFVVSTEAASNLKVCNIIKLLTDLQKYINRNMHIDVEFTTRHVPRLSAASVEPCASSSLHKAGLYCNKWSIQVESKPPGKAWRHHRVQYRPCSTP